MNAKEKLLNGEEFHLKGVPISEGIAIGELYYFDVCTEEPSLEVPITIGEVDREILRYRIALNSSKEDLQKLQNVLAKEGSADAVTIIDSHIQMLDDPFLTVEMEGKIRGMLVNTESVFKQVMTDYERQFSKIDNNFFQQRLIDIKDLSSRVLKHLNDAPPSLFPHIPKGSVIFSKELVPSETAEAPKSQVSAFITQNGGDTSHAALIAKAKGIPFVANIEIDLLHRPLLKTVIVDGSNGCIILNPKPSTIELYHREREEMQKRFVHFSNFAADPSLTQDNNTVDVLANIQNVEDIDQVLEYKVPEVGLLRSEFLFLKKDIGFCTDNDQYQCYSKLFKKAGSLPITFRLFDIGGDKVFCKGLAHELNPALGCRSIRFLLRHRPIFLTQLKALIRASVFGNIRILLPLITDVSELLEVKRCAKEIVQSFQADGLNVTMPPIGCMIEVPSAVIMADLIAHHSDFLSIGTNDLIQYTLAADRANPELSDIYKATHPSIIKMLKMIMDAANAHNIPVSLCGEMASNPIFTALLIGLGISKLSCPLRYIPIIKYTIRNISTKDAKELVKEVSTYSCSQDIHKALTEHYCKNNTLSEALA